jgi:uncharacterized SAM-binding protein YcdF (DUF218 family)
MRPRGRWRRLRRVAAGFLALLVIWVVGGWFVIVHPATDRPAPVDAIVVLGPPRVNGRFADAYRLVQQGFSDNLVISVATSGDRGWLAACHDGVAGAPAAHVYCFQPAPATTQGEARTVAAMAAQHRWSRVMVITSTYHVSRARMIVQRCYSHTLLMVPARAGIGLTEWTYEYLYQSGAYLKAMLHRAC